ncbi:MAG: hypothetical protein WBW79_02615 [Desulfocapsaceae bacterium]
MIIVNGILLILAGLGVMGFGLLLFYALLPLFYAFFGLGAGYWLGSLLTGAPEGQMSLIKLLFGFGGAIFFAGGAYFFEPFRRALIGVGLGSLLGGLIASALGLSGFSGLAIMLAAAVIGASLTVKVFDTFIIVSSAYGGAGLAMDGIHLIFRSLDIADRSAIAVGAVIPLLVWIVAGTIALIWQFSNLDRWVKKFTSSDL